MAGGGRAQQNHHGQRSQREEHRAVAVARVDVPAEEGFQYVNIHLDYGLEKSNGWIKKGANAVNDPLINPNFTGISIIDNTAHTFKACRIAGSTLNR